tara:strand:+ start:14400 stop:15467 length:1068 start_codon:yes stop_codon:yes gene_type:complete
MKVIAHQKTKNKGLPLTKTLSLNNTGYKSPRKKYGIIGCGNYAFSIASYFINKFKPRSISGVYDPNGSNSINLAKWFKADFVYHDPADLIKSRDIDMIFICSNHFSHADYAIKSINAGKAVHIEKPHVSNFKQLKLLIHTMNQNPLVPVFLGFNRPRTFLYNKLISYVNKENGPSFINWFIAGHQLDSDHWYFQPNEGGRIIGNICHWTDLSLRMVGIDNAFPIKINTIKSEISESDFSITILFGDGSIATISFSAKNYLFEGVRDHLNLHKGNLLAYLKDFQYLEICNGSRNHKYRTMFKSLGHGENIKNSLFSQKGESVNFVQASGLLFLAAKKSIDENRTIEIKENTIDSII